MGGKGVKVPAYVKQALADNHVILLDERGAPSERRTDDE
jgi:hypothetical protein